MLTSPMSTGRNFDEILRAIDSLQLTASQPVTTAAKWQLGEDVIIGLGVSDGDARVRFPWLPHRQALPATHRTASGLKVLVDGFTAESSNSNGGSTCVRPLAVPSAERPPGAAAAAMWTP